MVCSLLSGKRLEKYQHKNRTSKGPACKIWQHLVVGKCTAFKSIPIYSSCVAVMLIPDRSWIILVLKPIFCRRPYVFDFPLILPTQDEHALLNNGKLLPHVVDSRVQFIYFYIKHVLLCTGESTGESAAPVTDRLHPQPPVVKVKHHHYQHYSNRKKKNSQSSANSMHCKGEKGRIQPMNPEPLRDNSKDCDAAVTIQWLVADVTWFRESLLFLQMILTSSKFSLKGVPSKSESEDQKIPKRQKITCQSNRKSQIHWKSSSEPSNHMRFQRISKAGGSIELLNNKHSACPGKRECVFFFKPRASDIKHQKWHSLVSSHFGIRLHLHTCQIKSSTAGGFHNLKWTNSYLKIRKKNG